MAQEPWRAPMNVFDGQQQRSPRGGSAKTAAKVSADRRWRVESSIASRMALECRRLLDIEQFIDEEFVIRVHQAELDGPPHGRSLHARVRIFGYLQHALQDGGQRFASLAHTEVEHLARLHLVAERLARSRTLLDEARLSDAGITPNDDGHAASSLLHGGQRFQDLRKLDGATDEP